MQITFYLNICILILLDCFSWHVKCAFQRTDEIHSVTQITNQKTSEHNNLQKSDKIIADNVNSQRFQNNFPLMSNNPYNYSVQSNGNNNHYAPSNNISDTNRFELEHDAGVNLLTSPNYRPNINLPLFYNYNFPDPFLAFHVNNCASDTQYNLPFQPISQNLHSSLYAPNFYDTRNIYSSSINPYLAQTYPQALSNNNMYSFNFSPNRNYIESSPKTDFLVDNQIFTSNITDSIRNEQTISDFNLTNIHENQTITEKMNTSNQSNNSNIDLPDNIIKTAENPDTDTEIDITHVSEESNFSNDNLNTEPNKLQNYDIQKQNFKKVNTHDNSNSSPVNLNIDHEKGVIKILEVDLIPQQTLKTEQTNFLQNKDHELNDQSKTNDFKVLDVQSMAIKIYKKREKNDQYVKTFLKKNIKLDEGDLYEKKSHFSRIWNDLANLSISEKIINQVKELFKNQKELIISTFTNEENLNCKDDLLNNDTTCIYDNLNRNKVSLKLKFNFIISFLLSYTDDISEKIEYKKWNLKFNNKIKICKRKQQYIEVLYILVYTQVEMGYDNLLNNDSYNMIHMFFTTLDNKKYHSILSSEHYRFMQNYLQIYYIYDFLNIGPGNRLCLQCKKDKMIFCTYCRNKNFLVMGNKVDRLLKFFNLDLKHSEKFNKLSEKKDLIYNEIVNELKNLSSISKESREKCLKVKSKHPSRNLLSRKLASYFVSYTKLIIEILLESNYEENYAMKRLRIHFSDFVKFNLTIYYIKAFNHLKIKNRNIYNHLFYECNVTNRELWLKNQIKLQNIIKEGKKNNESNLQKNFLYDYTKFHFAKIICLQYFIYLYELLAQK